MSRTKRTIPADLRGLSKPWKMQYYGKLSIFGDSMYSKRDARREERRLKKAERRKAA